MRNYHLYQTYTRDITPLQALNEIPGL